jgi:hypothetical protein
VLEELSVCAKTEGGQLAAEMKMIIRGRSDRNLGMIPHWMQLLRAGILIAFSPALQIVIVRKMPDQSQIASWASDRKTAGPAG